MGSTVTAEVGQVHVHALETEGGVVGAGPAFNANISVLCVCVCGGGDCDKNIHVLFTHIMT